MALLLHPRLTDLTFAQIVVTRSRLWPLRCAIGIEAFIRHRGYAAILAHFDEVEAARPALIHPVRALELANDALDRAFDPKGLAAANAVKRLFLLEDARVGGSLTEIDLRREADDFLGASRFTETALHTRIFGKP